VSSETVSASSSSEKAGWSLELFRALILLLAASLLALTLNALSDKPVPLLARDGPGALPERAPRVTIAELKDLLTKRVVLLLDVRHADVFESAHPALAKNAPAEEFMEYYNKLGMATLLPAAQDVIVLCDSEQCPSADRVAKFLRGFKHDNVRVLQDGWNAYQGSGLPIEKGGP
jgi:3-mercaptopyruvate sulfurtransferase SseA